MDTGQQFAKSIKPIGCIVFLILFIMFLIQCFSAKAPLEGYVIPQTTEYYSEHLDEFKTELETDMFPRIEGKISCRISGDKMAVTIDSEHFDTASGIISHYYGSNIFIFEEGK